MQEGKGPEWGRLYPWGFSVPSFFFLPCLLTVCSVALHRALLLSSALNPLGLSSRGLHTGPQLSCCGSAVQLGLTEGSENVTETLLPNTKIGPHLQTRREGPRARSHWPLPPSKCSRLQQAPSRSTTGAEVAGSFPERARNLLAHEKGARPGSCRGRCELAQRSQSCPLLAPADGHGLLGEMQPCFPLLGGEGGQTKYFSACYQAIGKECSSLSQPLVGELPESKFKCRNLESRAQGTKGGQCGALGFTAHFFQRSQKC